MNTTIRSIHARRVWDSRGRPTVEAEVALQDGATGRAIVPAGASRGTREALELRDGSRRFAGLDVLRAIDNVNGAVVELENPLGERDAGWLVPVHLFPTKYFVAYKKQQDVPKDLSHRCISGNRSSTNILKEQIDTHG